MLSATDVVRRRIAHLASKRVQIKAAILASFDVTGDRKDLMARLAVYLEVRRRCPDLGLRLEQGCDHAAVLREVVELGGWCVKHGNHKFYRGVKHGDNGE